LLRSETGTVIMGLVETVRKAVKNCLLWALPLASKRRRVPETCSTANIYLIVFDHPRRYENTRRAAHTHLHRRNCDSRIFSRIVYNAGKSNLHCGTECVSNNTQPTCASLTAARI
jgi:hypothetical protein